MINLTKKQLLIVIIIVISIFSVIGYYIYSITESESYEQLEVTSEEKDTKNDKNVDNDDEIVIHIAGEVKNPGIVRIKEGARIADIIEKAGGLTNNANIKNINLAYIIEDGQKITIPSKEQVEEAEKEIENYISTNNGEGIIDEIR